MNGGIVSRQPQAVIGKPSLVDRIGGKKYNRDMATAGEPKQDPNETDRDSVSDGEREGETICMKRGAEDQPAPRARLTAEEKKTLADRLERCARFVSDQVCGSDDFIIGIPKAAIGSGKEWGVEIRSNHFGVRAGVREMEYELVFVRKEELDQIEDKKPWAVWRLGECAEGGYAPK